jgi:hypothetical protein
MKTKYDNLLKAYEDLLSMTEARLLYAIAKNKFNIEDLKKDIGTIEKEIEFTKNLKNKLNE